MYNELGLSKEDIRMWIKEAVHEEADKLIAKAFGDFDPKRILQELIVTEKYYGGVRLHTDLRSMMARLLIERLDIHVKKEADSSKNSC